MDPITMALIGAGGSALGGLISGIGANQAAGIQAGAANQSAQMSALVQAQALQAANKRFKAASANLSPYMQTGSKAMDLLMKYLQGGAENIGGGGSSLISTFRPTMEQLEQTPGYQFTLNQGLKAVQNSAAAKGLGASGNALQGGADYASGLASTTFQQQLQNYLAQNKQAFDMLYGPSTLGSNAAVANMQGATALNGQSIAGMTNMGNTLGAGVMGAANAQAGGINALYGGIGAGIAGASQFPMLASIYGRSNPLAGTPSTSGIPMNLGAYNYGYTGPVGSTLSGPAMPWSNG